MRKIAIIGGTGIDNPDTLKGFEKRLQKHRLVKHCATSAQ